MNTLQKLNLSERDFELIIDGLDAIPEKGMAGELIGDLMFGMLAKDNDEAQSTFKAEREKRNRQKAKETEMMKDDIKILQGKLLMLKRYLMENNALNETNSILNNFS